LNARFVFVLVFLRTVKIIWRAKTNLLMGTNVSWQVHLRTVENIKRMPQQFRVLRCFKCRFYQVDIVKIAKKWACKMCGEKQSVLVEIYRGPAPDCRRQVQALNMDEKSEQQQCQSISERILSGDIELAGRQDVELPSDEENRSPAARSKYECFKDSG
jgi:MRN-interacting protein